MNTVHAKVQLKLRTSFQLYTRQDMSDKGLPNPKQLIWRGQTCTVHSMTCVISPLDYRFTFPSISSNPRLTLLAFGRHKTDKASTFAHLEFLMINALVEINHTQR